MNTSDIILAMRERYKSPEYALMLEVGNSTGFGCKRHADAVAISLWPSRGLEIIGFEFKASRSDWLRELKNPAKAEAVAMYCDRWFVVASAGAVAAGECPPGWGLIEAKDGKLREVRAAPVKESQPIDRKFMAALIRRAAEADESLLAAAVAKRTAMIEAEVSSRIQAAILRETARVERERDDLKAVVSEFEKASGMTLNRYSRDAAELGEAMKAARIMGNGWAGYLVKAKRLCDEFSAAAAKLLPSADGKVSEGATS